MQGTKVGSVLPWILLAAIAGFGIWTTIAVYKVTAAVTGSAEATKYQALAAYVLVPVFQASLAALMTGAVAKGLFTTAHNALRSDNRPIKFFDW